MKRAIFAVLTTAAIAASLLAPGAPASAITATAYDATEVAPNLPSIGFEATSTSEFGDEIQLAAGPAKLGTVTVQMSSWGCEAMSGGNCVTLTAGATEAVPITLNVYKASVPGPDGTVVPGALIKSVTQTFAVPYRPGANLAKCPGGQWYDKKTKTCYNGKAFNIVFKLKPFKLNVADDIVLGVAYNTSHHGYNPIGETACNSTPQGCIYDSLNVGLGTTGVHTGSKPSPGTAFMNTTYGPPNTCDSTTALGVFNMDSPTSACWYGADDPMTPIDESYMYDPAFKVTTI
jgi:hypothetical protein